MKTDAEILDLLCTHEETAIAELQQKYWGYCYQIAQQVLRCREDAEECVNDVFLRCWESIPQKRPTYFRAYLRTVTRNLAISGYRTRHMPRRGGDMLHVPLQDCRAAEPGNLDAQVCDFVVIRQCLQQALSHRSLQDQRLFLRRYRDAEPISLLAEEFSLSENCVKSRLMRMRRSLRSTLEAGGVFV